MTEEKQTVNISTITDQEIEELKALFTSNYLTSEIKTAIMRKFIKKFTPERIAELERALEEERANSKYLEKELEEERSHSKYLQEELDRY